MTKKYSTKQPFFQKAYRNIIKRIYYVRYLAKLLHLTTITSVLSCIQNIMDIFLVIVWVILTIVWIIWSILPALPWPQLGYVALLLLQFTSWEHFSWTFIIIRWLINIALMVLDYIIPILWTKKFGWTKRWVYGSTIWLIVWVIILPLTWIVLGPFWLFGLILGPFAWAYIWERLRGHWNKHALKSAFGSFLGFITWIALKLVVCIIMAVYFFAQSYKILF